MKSCKRNNDTFYRSFKEPKFGQHISTTVAQLADCSNINMSWEEVSKAAQAELLESLPSKWKIERSSFESLADVSQIPKTCGILTRRQIEITELTATELAKRIARRELKAVDALEAFAARAAIAHQLVSWVDGSITSFMY